MAAVQFSRPAPAPGQPVADQRRRCLPPCRLVRRLPPSALPAGGPTTHYVRASRRRLRCSGGAMATRDAFLPAGQLPAFSPVRAVSLDRSTGWWRSACRWRQRLSSTRPGWRRAISRRLDRAYCAYNAGPPPRNGEVLGRRGGRRGAVRTSSTRRQPAVVKLRDAPRAPARHRVRGARRQRRRWRTCRTVVSAGVRHRRDCGAAPATTSRPACGRSAWRLFQPI